MIPKSINNNPTTLPIAKDSPKKRIPIIKTNAGAKLIKGYAFVISKCVIAAIQQSDAKKAEQKPEKMKGSKSAFNKKNNFSFIPSGKLPNWFNRHLRTICP